MACRATAGSSTATHVHDFLLSSNIEPSTPPSTALLSLQNFPPNFPNMLRNTLALHEAATRRGRRHCCIVRAGSCRAQHLPLQQLLRPHLPADAWGIAGSLVHVHNAQVAEHEPELVGEVNASGILCQQAHKHTKHHPAPIADLICLGPTEHPAWQQQSKAIDMLRGSALTPRQ